MEGFRLDFPLYDRQRGSVVLMALGRVEYGSDRNVPVNCESSGDVGMRVEPSLNLHGEPQNRTVTTKDVPDLPEVQVGISVSDHETDLVCEACGHRRPAE
jgi:hypothetical protein